ncbi:MAG: FeoA family protein [Bryobacteraceae bacterium]
MKKARGKSDKRHLDKDFGVAHTEMDMQLSGNKRESAIPPASLVDLRRGDEAVLSEIDLPVEDARRLMELGFLPGARVVAGQSAPGGDPRVFQVDGSEVAVRRETARRLKIHHKGRLPRKA